MDSILVTQIDHFFGLSVERSAFPEPVILSFARLSIGSGFDSRGEYLSSAATSGRAAAGAFRLDIKMSELFNTSPYSSLFVSLSFRTTAPLSATPANRPFDRDQERMSAVS